MKHLYIYLIIALISSCANVILPNGGPKDSEAPKVISTSPQTNNLKFNGDKIIFTFNEKINVSNFFNSFFISPPLNKKVDYSTKVNKLVIQLKEELKNNTTYYVSIGQSVSDLNEGNKIKNESLLFSTGQMLDTLYIKGYVKDLISGTAAKNCWLFLNAYKNENNYNNDFKQASYIAKTNEQGFFSFPNLKNETYHITALQDLDKNLTYSLPDEKIGFLDSLKVSREELYNINIFSQNDSLNSFATLELDSTSSIGKLKVDSIPNNYYLELYNDIGIISRGKDGKIFVMDSLLIGEYQLRLIKDDNSNNSWDSGNLENRIQAEEILFYPQTIKVRSNWDIEINWKTKE